MTKGFDTATKLSASAAKKLKEAGFNYAARYLGNSWKTFDRKEAEDIQNAGLQLISIFQKSANKLAYFTEAQGISDAKEAMKYAKAVGQPTGTAIYFAIDFDVTTSQLAAINQYINGLKKTLHTYKLGIYGSYTVMQAIKGKVDYYWQTYAWSRGKVADFITMHQYENDITVAGIRIDRNEIKKHPGCWGTIAAVEKEIEADKEVATYEVTTTVEAYITAADAKKQQHKKGTVKPGTYYIFNESQGMINVTSKSGVPGSWINPLENAKIHVVQSGETLTSIAKKYGTTLSALQKLNPQINNIHLIFPNQKVRVK